MKRQAWFTKTLFQRSERLLRNREIFKLDAKVNENKDAMTSLQSEENEGSNIKPVDSRLDGINDCTRSYESAA